MIKCHDAKWKSNIDFKYQNGNRVLADEQGSDIVLLNNKILFKWLFKFPQNSVNGIVK